MPACIEATHCPSPIYVDVIRKNLKRQTQENVIVKYFVYVERRRTKRVGREDGANTALA